MKKIMFVCTGNICRSPLAEGILKKLGKEGGLEIEVSSSGIESYHEGEKPDYRAISVAKAEGIDVSGIKSKKITIADVTEFDFIFGVTERHVEKLKKASPSEFHKKIYSLLEFSEIPNKHNNNVPDPYYGTEDDFKEVFNLLMEACEVLIEKLK